VLVDYHTHHYRCGHAEGQMRQYIEAARALGLGEVGLSDHSPIYHLGEDPHARPYTAMSRLELQNYLSEARALRAEYRGVITVRVGTESDYLPDYEEHYRRLWRDTELDYVIGSVHWLGEWSIFDRRLPPGHDDWSVYDEYLRYTQRLAQSRVFDILAHMDCIKTADHLPTREVTPLLAETLDAIADNGITVELNTSGWRKSIRECYPRPELFPELHRRGIPVILSSDSHAPEQVGYRFDEAVRVLQEAGYREIATFEGRERRMVPLA